MTDSPDAPNAAQIDSWNNRTGVSWAAFQERIDLLFAPVTARLMDAAAPRPGTHAIDIGCGCGASVLACARAAGSRGSVLGVDVSGPMLAVAAERVAAAGLAGTVRLRQADAAAHAFEPGAADLVLSRFGVMFFDDPAAAFHNIRGGVAAGGRLAFACWQPLAVNPWFHEPMAAIRPLLGEPPPADPDAPGPFAFARPERVAAILADAGFTAPAIQPHAVPIHLAGPGAVEAATDFVMAIGPAARAIGEADPAIRAPARAAIAQRLAAFDGPGGVVLGGAIFMVTARAA